MSVSIARCRPAARARRWFVAALACCALAALAASEGGSGGAHHGSTHGPAGHAGVAHGGGPAAATSGYTGHGRGWVAVPGHGWHGNPISSSAPPPGWVWQQPPTPTGATWIGVYEPWWWGLPMPFYDLAPPGPADLAAPEALPTPEPVPARWFCPTTSAYYPDVPTCSVPWLRVLPGR